MQSQNETRAGEVKFGGFYDIKNAEKMMEIFD